MDFSDTRTLVIIGVVVLAIIAIIALVVVERKRRSVRLRQHFGAEYDNVLLQQGDIRHAEAELAEREKRVEKFSIRTLSRADRERYLEDWATVQRRFVDDPSLAVNEADTLVTMVMSARGYPMADFEQRAADISVNHPKVVQNYRAARLIAVRRDQGQSTTEELRQAMVYYRSLFEDLLDEPRAERSGVTHNERIAS